MPDLLRPNWIYADAFEVQPPDGLDDFGLFIQPDPSSEQSFTVITAYGFASCPPDDPGGTTPFTLWIAAQEFDDGFTAFTQVGPEYAVEISATPDDDTTVFVAFTLVWIISSPMQAGAYVIAYDVETLGNMQILPTNGNVLTAVGA